MSRKNKDGSPHVKNEGKRVHISKAIFGLILAAIFYIGFPYCMLHYVIPEQLIEKAVAGLTIDWTNIIPLLERWMNAGIPMTVLASPVWLYPKGSRGRFFTSTVYMLASIGWLVYVINFGDLSNLLNITFNGSTYGFGIYIAGLLYLMIFFKCLKILTIYAVYKDNRSEYMSRFPGGQKY